VDPAGIGIGIGIGIGSPGGVGLSSLTVGQPRLARPFG